MEFGLIYKGISKFSLRQWTLAVLWEKEYYIYQKDGHIENK